MKKLFINISFLVIPATLPLIFYISSLFYDFDYRYYFFLCYLFYYIYLLFILIFRKQVDKRILFIGALEFLLVFLAIKFSYPIFFWFTGKLDFNLTITLTLWILYWFAFIEAKRKR